MVLRSLLLGLALLVVFCAVEALRGEWTHLVFGAVFSALVAAVLQLSRAGAVGVARSLLIAGTLACVAFRAWTMGEHFSLVWAWAPVSMIAALAVGGPRYAFRWTLVALAVLAGLVALLACGYGPSHPQPFSLTLAFSSSLAMILVTSRLAGSLDEDMRLAVEDARARADALEAARADLEARNRSLLEAQARLEALNLSLIHI